METIKKNVSHVCSLRRVTRVGKGGKTSRMSVLAVVGNEKGAVGYGLGRSVEFAEAVKKASRKGEKNMIKVPFYKNRTIYHDVNAKFCGAKVYLRKAKIGSGIIAGGCMRYIFEALGVKDVVCKSVGSSNPQNVLKATFKALSMLQTPTKLAKLRGIEVTNLFVDKEERKKNMEIKQNEKN